MKLKLKTLPIIPEVLRHATLAAARFVLHEAGSLLHKAAPLVHQAGEKLQALSRHPSLQSTPPSFNL